MISMRAAAALAVVVAACAPTAAVGPAPPCCLDEGRKIATAFRAPGITHRRFTHEELWSAIQEYVASSDLRVEEVGRSIHGRSIRAVTFGEGATTVLLWSQMHGDESTATMALVDLMNFFATGGDHPLRSVIRRELTVVMVPMLNPDGAALFQRENAVGIDINRDARALATPEAQTLRRLRDRLEPQFGFNLHDQSPRTLAGEGGLPVGIALLPPAADPDRSYGPVRARARLVAARIAEVLSREIPGRLAKYDDAFNPRAFGDLIQAGGTSTVLIESGVLPDDPDKQRLRAVNVTAIISALHAIGSGTYRAADPDSYERLPFNRRIPYDLLIFGGHLVLGEGPPIRADVAINYRDPVAGTEPEVAQVGDLAGSVAMDTLDVRELFLHPEFDDPVSPSGLRWIRRGDPMVFTVRRGPEADSPVVQRFDGR